MIVTKKKELHDGYFFDDEVLTAAIELGKGCIVELRLLWGAVLAVWTLQNGSRYLNVSALFHYSFKP